MRLFLKILIGVVTASVGVALYLLYNTYETSVYLTNYVKTQPAREGRKKAREQLDENPSNTKPGNEGETDPPIDQPTSENLIQ